MDGAGESRKWPFLGSLAAIFPLKVLADVLAALVAGAVLWGLSMLLGILPEAWPFLIGGLVLVGIAVLTHRVLRDRIPYKKRPRVRWDKIESIKLGYIHYDPFVRRKGPSELEGFGVDILKEIIGGVIRTPMESEECKWKDVISRLDRGKFDLLVTPLLETFERTKGCDFTAPLFYSNIGLYTSNMSSESLGIQETTIDSVVAAFAKLEVSHIRIVYIKGEISEKQGRKLHNRLRKMPNLRVKLKVSSDSLTDTLKSLSKRDGNHYFMFCESFFAREIVGDNSVTNVLRACNLLYPVCYAVRNGDYVLRTRLNIGLLELAEKEGGILGRLEKYLVSYGTITQEEVRTGAVKRHFISAWEDPRLKGA